MNFWYQNASAVFSKAHFKWHVYLFLLIVRAAFEVWALRQRSGEDVTDDYDVRETEARKCANVVKVCSLAGGNFNGWSPLNFLTCCVFCGSSYDTVHPALVLLCRWKEKESWEYFGWYWGYHSVNSLEAMLQLYRESVIKMRAVLRRGLSACTQRIVHCDYSALYYLVAQCPLGM